MNNQLPYILYKNNKHEFLHKQCAICLSVLFYPEESSNNKMVNCSKISCCSHMFHTSCIEKVSNNKCPECRKPFQIDNVKNIDVSIELAIRNDAFDHNEVDEELRQTFTNESLTIRDYPYHKDVFKRWRTEKDIL